MDTPLLAILATLVSFLASFLTPLLQRLVGTTLVLSIGDKRAPDSDAIEIAYDKAQRQLPGGDPTSSEVPEASTPTPSGKTEALAVLDVYMRDLLAESSRIAKRAGAEQPSKAHVKLAADRIGILRSRAGVAADVVLSLGAILIGGGVAYQVNLWTGGHAAGGATIWVVVGFAAGVGLFVGAATVKWRQR